MKFRPRITISITAEHNWIEPLGPFCGRTKILPPQFNRPEAILLSRVVVLTISSRQPTKKASLPGSGSRGVHFQPTALSFVPGMGCSTTCKISGTRSRRTTTSVCIPALQLFTQVRVELHQRQTVHSIPFGCPQLLTTAFLGRGRIRFRHTYHTHRSTGLAITALTISNGRSTHSTR